MNFRDDIESSGSKTFFKIKDGESVVGCFRGEIHEFYSKWVNGKGVPCEPDEPGAGFRFRINFIYKENGALVAKVWEQGVTVYEILRNLNKEWGLPTTWVRITRSGATKDDTSYTILPIKEFQITPGQEKQLAGVSLQVLEGKEQDNKPAERPKNYAPGADDNGGDSDGIPF